MFCKHVKEQGNRRALVMHTMLKHIQIQELRMQIYKEANLMRISTKEKKEMCIFGLAVGKHTAMRKDIVWMYSPELATSRVLASTGKYGIEQS
jgi:ribosome-interacting GTPase 1